MELENKKVCVVGYGKSGKACVKKLLEIGAKVKVSELNKPDDNELFDNVEYEFGKHSQEFLCDSDLIVVSPGIHLDISPIVEAKRRTIPIISEIELAYSFFTKPIIAITGTNGKTTTTTLIGEILKNVGYRVAVAGNIGVPLISVDDSKLDYIVAEISSYQLETIDRFRPYIAVLLNITPDHLERYKTMENYAAAKKRIFENQTPSDYCVFNYDDKLCCEVVKDVNSKKVPFSRLTALEEGFFINDCYVVKLNENIVEPIFKISDLKLKGLHNLENAMAASIVAHICGVPSNDISKTLKSFSGVEHRIEFVREINGVQFINDSKATNPDSTIVALKSVANGQNVVLILGGKDKGTSLEDLSNCVKEFAKSVVLIGQASDRFEDELKKNGYYNIVRENTFEGAIKRAYSLAVSGDVVLLSPACASFDMFKDFEERGKIFKEIVNSL